MWNHSEPLVGYGFTRNQRYRAGRRGMIMEMELGTTANRNIYYINTAQIPFIQFEFRNLTNPQMKNIPASL